MVINGVTIPKDATIVIPIALLHYSPLYWKDPEKFDPDRLALFQVVLIQPDVNMI